MAPEGLDEPAGQSALAMHWTGVAWLSHDLSRARRWLDASIQACVARAAPARRRLLEHPAMAHDEGAHRRQQALLARRDGARQRSEALALAAGRPVEADSWRRAALVEALADCGPWHGLRNSAG